MARNMITRYIVPAWLMLIFLHHPNYGLAEELPIRNKVINATTGMALAEYRGWIYKQNKDEANWHRLIPGKCPQWLVDGTRFYYFLDVGYDGSRAELWSADSEGNSRLRMTREDYFIWNTSPVISSDGTRLAYHYDTCRASGDYSDIVVIELGNLENAIRAKVVLRMPAYTKIELIEWIDNSKLKALVNGKQQEVATDLKGFEHLP